MKAVRQARPEPNADIATSPIEAPVCQGASCPVYIAPHVRQCPNWETGVLGSWVIFCGMDPIPGSRHYALAPDRASVARRGR